jgi:hypothetical protein
MSRKFKKSDVVDKTHRRRVAKGTAGKKKKPGEILSKLSL